MMFVNCWLDSVFNGISESSLLPLDLAAISEILQKHLFL